MTDIKYSLNELDRDKKYLENVTEKINNYEQGINKRISSFSSIGNQIDALMKKTKTLTSQMQICDINIDNTVQKLDSAQDSGEVRKLKNQLTALLEVKNLYKEQLRRTEEMLETMTSARPSPDEINNKLTEALKLFEMKGGRRIKRKTKKLRLNRRKKTKKRQYNLR